MTFQPIQRRKEPWLAAVLTFFLGGLGWFYLGWQYGLPASAIWVLLFRWTLDLGDFAALLLQVGLAVVAAKVCAAKNAKLEFQQQAKASQQRDLSQLRSALTESVARAPMSPVRKSLVFAGTLFFVDAFLLNQGIVSGLVVLIVFCCIPVALWPLVRKDVTRFRHRIVQIGIVLAGCFAVFGMNWLQNELADRKAVKLGTACLEFHAKNSHYPRRLDDLVPNVISEIPTAKYSLMDSQFHYIVDGSGEPEIYYLVMPPFGRRFYHVEKGTWGYLD